MFHRQVHANNCLLRKSVSSSSRFSLPPCLLLSHPVFSSLPPCFLAFYSTLSSSFLFRSSNFSASTSSLETHSLLSHFSLVTLSQSPLLHFSLFFSHCCLVFLFPFVSISFITLPIAFSLIHSFISSLLPLSSLACHRFSLFSLLSVDEYISYIVVSTHSYTLFYKIYSFLTFLTSVLPPPFPLTLFSFSFTHLLLSCYSLLSSYNFFYITPLLKTLHCPIVFCILFPFYFSTFSLFFSTSMY